jgi:DNA-binding response OmpR family regulator
MAKGKIMVAEDEADIARLVAFKLKGAGYEVLLAADGEQAMEILQREVPDLLLLDAMMPVMDGWHVLGKIRASERFRKLPVIMFTAQGQERDQIRGRASGAQDFIVKPFAIGELLPRIERLLAQKQPAGSVPPSPSSSSTSAPQGPAASGPELVF